MILLYHRFDIKGRRRKCGNLQKKKKNLNPEQPTAINQQNSMKKKKKKKLKSRATHNHKLTKFHEQLKRREREREQYIEIKESKKHV